MEKLNTNRFLEKIKENKIEAEGSEVIHIDVTNIEEQSSKKKEWIYINVPQHSCLAESEKAVLVHFGEYRVWISKKLINKQNDYNEFVKTYTISLFDGMEIKVLPLIPTEKKVEELDKKLRDVEIKMNLKQFLTYLKYDIGMILYNNNFGKKVQEFIDCITSSKV